ncbi:hypothetical protein, partial [Tolypothrix sp. VBCCA 56010]|uniref:hypothetical protein n=1 Tax=Tolypothrix sp. VBCCA 56010 TaxID=3137731 RepID=UPI003D7DC9FF
MGIGQWAMGFLNLGQRVKGKGKRGKNYYQCPMTAGAPLGETPRPHCLPHAPCPMSHDGRCSTWG